MKALMLQPLEADSLRFEDIREPSPADGEVLVESLALGICGTDRELIAGRYGSAPPGHRRLVIGHESLGVVREAPAGSGLKPGDLVVPFVRVPDADPCACCVAGEWDRCIDGRFTEHGIRSRDGFGRPRYRIPADRAIPIDASLGILGVLMEPTSIAAKAWLEIDRLSARCGEPRRALITGAGPIGLLAALMAKQRGLDVHVHDHAEGGIKTELVAGLGAIYHGPPAEALPRDFDVVIECTGVGALAAEAPLLTRSNGMVCLLGVSAREDSAPIATGRLNDSLVLGNRTVFGAVNANRRHFEAAHDALRAANPKWLNQLITRRVPFEQSAAAFEKVSGDIKTVIVFDGLRENGV